MSTIDFYMFIHLTKYMKEKNPSRNQEETKNTFLNLIAYKQTNFCLNDIKAQITRLHIYFDANRT